MKKTITTFQLLVITFFLTRTFLLTDFYNTLLTYNFIETIISIVISTLIGILLILIFTRLLIKQKEKDLTSILNSRFPFIYKSIFKCIIIIILLLIGSFILNKFSLYVNNNYLNTMNTTIIAITLLISSYYLIKGKKQAIARFTEVMFYIFVTFFLLVTINISNNIDSNNFMPYIININNIIELTIYITSCLITPLFLLTMFPKKKEHYTKTIVIGFTIASLTILMTVIMITGTLGSELAYYYQYPETMILRNINFFNILDRMEIFLSFGWLIDITVVLSIIIYTTINLMNTKTINKLIYIIITGILLLLIKTNTTTYLSIICIILISILTLLYFQIVCTKTKKD